MESGREEGAYKYLELKTDFLGIQTFLKDSSPESTHLQIDNTIALAHLVKMGRPTVIELIALTKKIYEYLLPRGITLTAEYIPSKLNVESDF